MAGAGGRAAGGPTEEAAQGANIQGHPMSTSLPTWAKAGWLAAAPNPDGWPKPDWPAAAAAPNAVACPKAGWLAAAPNPAGAGRSLRQVRAWRAVGQGGTQASPTRHPLPATWPKGLPAAAALLAAAPNAPKGLPPPCAGDSGRSVVSQARQGGLLSLVPNPHHTHTSPHHTQAAGTSRPPAGERQTRWLAQRLAGWQPRQSLHARAAGRQV